MRRDPSRPATVMIAAPALVAGYLLAIATANLAAARFGPGITIASAFVLIGLDLTVRDRLHDAWHHRRLILRMATLIAAGGAISYALNANAGPIALASTVAFVASSSSDAAAYALLGRRSRDVRVNGSNIAGAAVDSVLFPSLAFGAILPAIVLGQFAAKVAGGFVWHLALRR